jgi:hypothetical protein
VGITRIPPLLDATLMLKRSFDPGASVMHGIIREKKLCGLKRLTPVEDLGLFFLRNTRSKNSNFTRGARRVDTVSY